MVYLGELADVLAEWDRVHADVDSRGFTEDEEMLAGTGEALANAIRGLLGEPKCVQALALARLLGDREATGVHIATEPFDLPDGYWQAEFLRDGFTCGIAPNGDVSS